MKSLASILKQQEINSGFPVRGQGGYAGEQDGSTPVLTFFYIKSKKDAKKVSIPNGVGLHWATYTPRLGWQGVAGHWSNDETITEYALPGNLA